jgi:hypothetical protein
VIWANKNLDWCGNKLYERFFIVIAGTFKKFSSAVLRIARSEILASKNFKNTGNYSKIEPEILSKKFVTSDMQFQQSLKLA